MNINKAGLTGFMMCFIAILFGIASNGGIETIVNFLHIPSFFITAGGVLFAVMTTADFFEDFRFSILGFCEAFKRKGMNTEDISKKVIEMSDIARKEGLLALEEKSIGEEKFCLCRGKQDNLWICHIQGQCRSSGYLCHFCGHARRTWLLCS